MSTRSAPEEVPWAETHISNVDGATATAESLAMRCEAMVRRLDSAADLSGAVDAAHDSQDEDSGGVVQRLDRGLYRLAVAHKRIDDACDAMDKMF